MGRSRSEQVKAWISERPVLAAGVAMIVVQTVFRAWAVYGSWFQFDDFAFMSRMMNNPLGSALMRPYAGHVMPGGFLLTWLNDHVATLNFALPATELLALQALADVGCLVLLISLFGVRPGILPPLALYLFWVITLPAFIWWAAGVNQMPLQVVFFWGMYTHVRYLRSRDWRYAAATLLLTVASLAFYEKTLLMFGVYGVFAVSYYASGDIGGRLVQLWQRYRSGILAYSAVAVAYLVFYALWGLNFTPGSANDHPLGPVFTRMALEGWATGVLGGPLGWEYTTDLFAIAKPTQMVVLLACVLVFVVLLEMSRTRRRAKRAWIVPGFLLGADILLVAAGRASFVGPAIALDFRYQTELAAATAVAVALSLLPVRDCVESVEVVRPSEFFDKPVRVGAATAAVAVLGVVSSMQYVVHWQGAHESRTYFANVGADLRKARAPLPMVDVGVPDFLMWAFGYPENATSHVLRMYSDKTRWVRQSTDTLYMVAPDGHVSPVLVPAVRSAQPGRPKGCPYPVRSEPVTIPLNGPVIGGGWWIRFGYAATGDSPVTITAGDSVHQVQIRDGLHSLFVSTSGDFDSVTFSGLQPGAKMCVSELTLGQPTPYTGTS